MNTPVTLLVIDNLDSFTYNVVQGLWAALKQLGRDDINVQVVPNTSPKDALPEWNTVVGAVISPGPGRADNIADLGLSAYVLDEIENTYPETPLLGVCLGMQAMAHRAGFPLVQAPDILHGKQSELTLFQAQHWLWQGLTHPVTVMRYHSWGIESLSVRSPYQLLASSADGLAQAMAHTTYPWVGVQFHPESIGSPQGQQMLANFVASLSAFRASCF